MSPVSTRRRRVPTSVRPPFLVGALAWKALLAVLRIPRGTVAGVQVRFMGVSEGLDEICVKLSEALEILRRTDRRRYKAVRHYTRHLVVWPADRSAVKPRSGVVLLSTRALVGGPAVLAAAALVHETTHLRIAHMGVKWRPALAERIERRCVREESAFLRLCNEDVLAASAEGSLSERWWTEEAMAAFRERTLDQVQASRWMRRLRSILSRWFE